MANSIQPPPLTAGPLTGLRVLELGRGLAPGVVGLLLAEQGAEVVRLEVAGLHELEPVLHAMLGRNKCDMALTPADTAHLPSLLAHADILIEDLGDARLAALGLNSTTLIEQHPQLIHCRLSAFTDRDPRQALPDHEAVVGMAGFLYHRPVGRPLYHTFSVGSVLAAIYAASAVAAALIARRKTGRGQKVEANRYEATLYAQVLQILVKGGVPRSFLPLKMVATPFMSSWRCQDGRFIYLHVTLPAHNRRLLERLHELGVGELAKALQDILSPTTMSDPSQVKSVAEAKRIRKAMSAIFLTKSADAWEAALGHELCCIKVRTVNEWLQDSATSGMHDVCDVHDPVLGTLTTVGPTVALNEALPSLDGRRLGTESPTALSARWARLTETLPPLPASPVPMAEANAPPLQGLRVLDLSRVIAGPASARVLAELGADVVSLQSPTKLDWALSFHLIFNAGKRSVTLDFTTPEGKVQLWKLIEHVAPDVLIQNYRSLELAREIGIGPEAVRARLPNVIYTHMNAYGETGGWCDRPGFEQVVQAVTGIQMTYGGGQTPKLLPSPILDIGSGLLGAYGTLLGLYARDLGGAGCTVSTHMTTLAILFQLADVAACQHAKLDAANPTAKIAERSRECLVVAQVLRAKDGPAVLSGRPADLQTWLCQNGGTWRVATETEIPWTELGKLLGRHRVRDWNAQLRTQGLSERIGLIAAGSFGRLCDDVSALGPAIPVARRRSFPGAPQPLVFVRCPVHLSTTAIVDVEPSPLRGAHTVELMAAAGVALPPGTGIIEYPPKKALVPWLVTLVRWGYYLWRSGGI